MATIAEMLIGTTAQGIQQTGENIQKGAQLAQGIQEVQMKRQQLEQQKKDHEQNKLENMTNDILKARTLGGKALSGYRDFLKNKARVLNIDNVYTPESIDLITSVPENLDRFEVILNQVQSGELPLDQAQEMLQDEGLFYNIDPAERQRLAAAAKTAILEKNKQERAETAAQAQLGKQIQGQQAAGQVELAKKVAGQYSEYSAAGGRAGLESALNNLEEAAAALETGVVKTGKVTNIIPGFRSDTVQAVVNPKLLEVRTQAQAALNKVLRATLGAQFTEKEGERILNQIWDDKLKPQVNAKKIRAKIEELRDNVNDAESEFARFGYLQAKPGKKATPVQKAQEPPKAPGNAFAPNDAQKQAYMSLPPAEQTAFVDEIMKRFKLSRAEVMRLLGGK